MSGGDVSNSSSDASPEKSKAGQGKIFSSDEITQWHLANQDRNRALCGEISFALETAMQENEIKISDISTRVKSLESVIEKFSRKGYSDFAQITDIVGARVVCLFRQDLFLIKDIIEKKFQVSSFDEKSYSDPNAFGYMSLHFICKLPQEYSGPRYDTLKSVPFELQIRTICMHAWSAVQHALDYKGEWDVPEALKKDINALSAIFYVADTQFSAVYSAKAAGGQKETSSILEKRKQKKNRDLNLDAIISYAREKFPQREPADASAFSSLVKELYSSGYRKIAEVDKDIDRVRRAFELDEALGDVTYEDVGAIRVSIALASKEYREKVYENENPFSPKVLEVLEKSQADES